MSGFKKAVCTSTIVKVFHLHTKPIEDQFQPTEIWLWVLFLEFTQTKLPSKGNFHLSKDCKIELDIQMFNLTASDLFPSVSLFLATTHNFYIMP